MKRLVAIVIALVLSAVPAVAARAEQCTDIVKILAGETSDCDGIVLPPEEYRYYLGVDSLYHRLQLSAAADARVSAIELRQCQQESADREMSRVACEREKSPLPKPVPFYESALFWGVTGTVVGVVVTLVVVALVKE